MNTVHETASPPPANAPGRYSAMLRHGHLVNHYQPIIGLCSNRVLGVEVLARLEDGAALLMPAEFLDHLDADDLDDLLFRSIGAGLAVLKDCSLTHPNLTMSFNVGCTLLMSAGFADRVIAALQAGGVDQRRITLEILEDHDIQCISAAGDAIDRLQARGIRVALDDVGTAYSSLTRMRQFPVDQIKLDQIFVRTLAEKPDNLHFVVSMVSLARGLRKDLVIEGVETADIANALRVLGVNAAQGFAIARPMPGDALQEWLSRRVTTRASRTPDCLLGAYAAHLMIVEICELMVTQSIGLTWPDTINDPHACVIGKYLDRVGQHETGYGLAHKDFHATITTCADDPMTWKLAAETLLERLADAVLTDRRARAAADTS